MIHALLFTLSFFAAPVSAPPNAQPTAAASVQTPAAVGTPIFANPSCPIMGKPVSTRLFAETDKGRIYVCCKSCIKDILADVPAAYRTAYPAEKKIENKLCPVSGGEITKDSPTVVLQGFTFRVRRAEDVAAARENAQIVLAKLNDPALVDLDNRICPVTGDAVAKNTFVVIEGTIVHLSSAKLVDEIAKDPAKVLKQAREIRAKQDKDSRAASGGAKGS